MKCVRWQYGVTTIPERLDELLPQTLHSLARAGFGEPRLFVDGVQDDTDYRHFDLPVTTRHPRVRAYGNWYLGLLELYLRDPGASHYAMFQDDLVAVRNLRAYLEARPWPEHAYLNLFSAGPNNAVVHDQPPGWYSGAALMQGTARTYHGRRQQKGWGAVALLFDRECLMSLLTHSHLVNHVHDGSRGWRKIDGAVVEAMNRINRWEYVHAPGLVDHRGMASTVGNTPWKSFPSKSFQGEDFDALELLK